MSYFPWSLPEQQEQPRDMVTRNWRPGIVALAATMALSACNNKDSPVKADGTPQALAPAATPAVAQPQPVAYVPPSPDVLYQMVAPIALYPDKLVAQILAGATYPDQISAAETWLGQNPGLQKAVMTNAVNAQNWDPSVKSLTQFPNVLEQMASNLPWTTALGKAYYNDPSDVMNAIQVMRNRAYKAGTLKTSKQLKVNVAATPAAMDYTPGTMSMPLPEPVIAPPEQFIEIAPSQMDTVYVPQYDPGVVYGQPLPIYGGYRYVEVPPSAPVVGVPVMAGLLGFGAGIVLVESMNRHPSWGWNSWNMHWGDPDRPWRHGDHPPPPQARPAVVYNNTTYISQSRTVVQNIRRTDNTYVNNVYENGGGGHGAQPGQPQAASAFAPQHGSQPSTMAAGAVGAAAVGAAALAVGNHQRPQQAPNPSPLAALPQGRPGFAQGQGQPQGPSHLPNGNAFMQPHNPHDRSAGPSPAGFGRQPQAPQMQAAMADKAQQQMQQQTLTREQQQRAQEQAQREQQQQRQQQRTQEQAQRQQQMQQQAQMQQQRVQDQAQRQQQMQQVREQQQRQQQAQMQQQRAQEQAQRQQQMQQQRAQEQAQRQQQQQARMQTTRGEGRPRGDHDHH